MQGLSGHAHLEELEAFAARELSQAQRDLGELGLLIRQTNAEVEQLTQRSDQAMNIQREAEGNLDGFSRQDLRQIFASSADARLRLLMMQSQVELLQSRQQSIETCIDVLQRTIQAIGPASAQPENRGTVISPRSSSSLSSPDNEIFSDRSAIGKIIQIQEDERSRTARLVHDGPIQALTNVLLRAEICERLIGRDPDAARAELSQLKDLIASNLRDTRRFVFDLRPMTLDDLGLMPSLRKYLEAFREKSQLTVEFTAKGRERRLDPQIEVAIFRIIQESLQNVVQHARAGMAKVWLELDGERIDIVVEDDGSGFDADAAQSMARGQTITTFGLAGIIGRTEMLGGRLSIDSSP
ncbi:MAG: sensor histidine kinase, partial [Dehalococcoidia bacterium]|nr:sensor histidine kinase [Dehalococcoidia bacterium]